MYSKTQMNKIRHRMNFGLWRTKDKLTEYSGLVKIICHDKRKCLNDANELRRRQTQIIRELRKDCQYFNSYLQNSLFGTNWRLKNILNRSAMQMKFPSSDPKKIIEYFAHSNTVKQKSLDSVKYKKRMRMKVYERLLYEKAKLKDIEANDNRKYDRSVELITNKFHMFILRQNAAAEIYKLYKTMINLLHGDSQYFNATLNVLNEDLREQSGCLVLAAEIGEFANSELQYILKQYSWLEVKFKESMRFREKEVKCLKRSTKELMNKCRAVCGRESLPGYIHDALQNNSLWTISQATSTGSYTEEVHLEEKQKCLIEVAQLVAEVILVPTFYDVFPRMLRQLQQEEILYCQIQKMMELRKRALLVKNNMENIHASLIHVSIKSATYFANQKQILEQKIKYENYRMQDEDESSELYGTMLATLGIALNSIFESLSRARESTTDATESISENEAEIQTGTAEEVEKTFSPPVEKNPMLLINSIREKLENLLTHVTEMLDDEKMRDVKLHWRRQYLPNAMSIMENVDIKKSCLEDELEEEDTTVMTRSDVKLMAKELVEKERRLLKLKLLPDWKRKMRHL